jgi:hypothetical protein
MQRLDGARDRSASISRTKTTSLTSTRQCIVCWRRLQLKSRISFRRRLRVRCGRRVNLGPQIGSGITGLVNMATTQTPQPVMLGTTNQQESSLIGNTPSAIPSEVQEAIGVFR